MKGVAAHKYSSPDLRQLRRQNEIAEIRKNQADLVFNSMSDTSRSDGSAHAVFIA